MIPAKNRFLLLLAIPPLVVLAASLLYMFGMLVLEGQPRDFWSSLEWAAETVTTTGYGADADWKHPLMVIFVISLQFVGVFLVYMIVPFYVIPYIDERFESRLPRQAPKLDEHVVIYRYGPAVELLLDDLDNAGVANLVVEHDESEVRTLLEHGHKVIYGPTADDALPAARIESARCLITNGSDEENAAVILLARQLGYTGEIVALVEEPDLRRPMTLAGADAVFTPRHLLATVLAARACHRIEPRVSDLPQLGHHLEVSEVRVEESSLLAGQTLADADLTRRTGTTILGQWIAGRLETRITASMRIEPRGILVAIGRPENLGQLEELAGGASFFKRQGPFVIAGCGIVGGKVRQLLRDIGEEVIAIDREPGADLVGDVLDLDVLDEARLDEARAIILALDSDSATLFAAVVLRDRAPHLPIIARVNESHNVARIHRAGADFALSFSQVSGQILARRLLGQEWISVVPQLKVLKMKAGALAGRTVGELDLRQRTGCSVVAVERGDEVLVELDGDFRIRGDDDVYLCGSAQETARFAQELA